ncbi:phytanoyl-CoA dioxygenase family protein [Pseudomonas sp. BMS12]|uniref:phytanoyl-CoA dioxygenase family protein n=1 Tax=Pseudomonas sp. BMS12 TaxID=1796033 RepID=UPI000A668292|nr:phytanoyl-CoA dioxygenase family protein [Pseudomonas sp. BMS12]
MFSKYRLMRGVFKRKLVRESVWRLICFANRRKVEFFRAGQNLSESSLEKKLAPEAYIEDLRRDGAVIGPSLSEADVRYLRELAERTPCFADRNPALGFYIKDLDAIEAKLSKPLLLAQYFNVQSDPVVARLSKDPFMLSLAAGYLGVEPKLMSVNMWWTFPVNASAEDRSRHAHVFHYDLDDIKFIKFFFYLTDVDGDSGPHVFVRGSNRDIRYKNSFLKSKRFTDEEIVSSYGVESVVEVYGSAGSCLIEDTITLHKGVTPLRRPRLLLQFEFSINIYPEVSCVVDPALQKIVV